MTPTPSRRRDLQTVAVQAGTHVGLWLDKFVPTQDSDGSKGIHIREVESIGVPAGYAAAFERRKEGLKAAPRPEGCVLEVTPARADGRMVIGLGQKSVIEVGLTLDHTWGVPYIPGSSLKGIAAVAARTSADARWHEKGESYLALFGDTDEVGAVDFLDAWWVPTATQPVHLDTMTVHHSDYYQRSDETPPSDMDSPIPIAFASVTGTFEVMLEGPEKWVGAALQLLKRGLAEHGIGAKTAGGYGRLSLEYVSAAERAEQEREKTKHIAEKETVMRQQQKEEARRRDEELVKRVTSLQAGTAAQRVPEMLASAPPSSRQALAQAIVKQLSRKWLRERGEKDWVKELLGAADGVSPQA